MNKAQIWIIRDRSSGEYWFWGRRGKGMSRTCLGQVSTWRMHLGGGIDWLALLAELRSWG